jgi:hypothetical protein
VESVFLSVDDISSVSDFFSLICVVVAFVENKWPQSVRSL